MKWIRGSFSIEREPCQFVRPSYRVDLFLLKIENWLMKISSTLVCLLLSAFLPGCAVGPLVSHETARTVGKSNHEFIGGYGQAGYVLKWNFGLAENLDLGLHWETLSIGVRAKYAFINSESGWSLASALGTGESIGGSHYYGDLIGSYFKDSWEPYGTLRIVHVKNDPLEFKNTDTGQVSLFIDRSEYQYGQFILGARYWLDDHWLISLEASSLFKVSSGFESGQTVFIGASLGYRF